MKHNRVARQTAAGAKPDICPAQLKSSKYLSDPVKLGLELGREIKEREDSQHLSMPEMSKLILSMLEA